MIHNTKTESINPFDRNLRASLTFVLLLLFYLAAPDAPAQGPRHLPGLPSFDNIVGSFIDASGKIVGTYDGLQSVACAFVLENRQYQRIDTPFGTQAEAFAINDQGSITGVGYTDPFTGYFTLTLLEQIEYSFVLDTEPFFTGPFTPFIRSRNGFSPFQFPGSLLTQIYSINNSNDLAGFFFEPDGASELGMVTVYGYPYAINGIVFGNDDLNRICGFAYDYNTGSFRGFIGTLLLKQNAP